MQISNRILIAGAHGFVGKRAMAQFPSAVAIPSNLLREQGQALERFVKENAPDVIFNLAGIADIDNCARDPEGSYRANVLLPVSLARCAAALGSKLVSFSSDQVYTGCKEEGPFAEAIELAEPKNLYACHKLESERRVLEITPNAAMLRLTWIYDMPLYGSANRGNFLVNTLQSLIQGRAVCVSSRQHRGITYLRQIVELLDPLSKLPGGVYNYGSENKLNMFETAKYLLRLLNAEGQIEDTQQDIYSLWMDISKLRNYGICFDSTTDGFARCIRDYGLVL